MNTDKRLASNPFPGLRAFTQYEADLFFGRDRQSDELVRRLAAHRFVAVVGTSGSGKSSLVRAGLMPSLDGGLMASAGAHWRMMVMRPQDDPIGALAQALIEAGVVPPVALAEQAALDVLQITLRRSSVGLVEAVQLARLEPHENLLVVVDQFEELFRFANLAGRRGAAEDAPAFVKLLLEATREARQAQVSIYVVITMRSDFLGDCARFRDLPEAISESQYLIPRLTRDELQAVITGPIGVRGGRIAPGLVQRLLNDMGDDMDQLPVLQHALMRTWQHWAQHKDEGSEIDTGDLKAIGDLDDALSQHAEEAFDALAGDHGRRVAEKLFKCVTERGPDNREVRRPTPLARIAAITGANADDLERVIDVFRAPGRSFLMPPAGMPLTEPIDITHESLIRQWTKLRRWVDEEAESRATYLRLVEAARLHEAGKINLWEELAADDARAWWQREAPTEAWAERYASGFDKALAFLDQSEHTNRIARDAQRRAAEEKTSRQQRITFLSATLGIVFSVLGAFSAWSWQRTQLALKGSEQTKAVLATTLALVQTQKDEADRERRKAEEQARLAEERLQQLLSIDKIVTTISDKELRQRLANERHLGEVRPLTSSQQERLATELKTDRAGKAAARLPTQYGLKLWAVSTTLRVRLLKGTPQQHARAELAAQEWTRYANVRFRFGDEQDAEIRISFDPLSGAWSTVGTDALGVPLSQPTMNLGIDTEASALHEFGHALGLIHENSSPNARLPWDKQAVYRTMTNAPNFWDRRTVDTNLFEQLTGIEYRPFDADSIMMYGFPASYFTDSKARGGGQVLSASDKQFIAKLYPGR